MIDERERVVSILQIESQQPNEEHADAHLHWAARIEFLEETAVVFDFQAGAKIGWIDVVSKGVKNTAGERFGMRFCGFDLDAEVTGRHDAAGVAAGLFRTEIVPDDVVGWERRTIETDEEIGISNRGRTTP